MSFIKTALLSIVASVSVYATLCYTLGTPGQPTVTLTVERVVPLELETHNMFEAELPSLLELEEVSHFTYPVERTSILDSCFEFEVLPASDRAIFVLDAAQDEGIDSFNPCVRDHAREAGEAAATQCRAGGDLSEAFRAAVAYFNVNCDPRVPQWDLEPATPHTELLEGIF